MIIAFRPKLLDCLPGYTRAQFAKDFAAGITVGVLALPLAKGGIKAGHVGAEAALARPSL